MCVCVCWWELTFATSCGQLWGWWVEMGEPCHVFMLTNELITQPLIYFNLCHFTGMLQQSNACRLWVISWQLKANYYSSNSSTPQALNHKCYSRSICLFMTLLSWNLTTGLESDKVDSSRVFLFFEYHFCSRRLNSRWALFKSIPPFFYCFVETG